MNLNFSVNLLPQTDMAGMNIDDEISDQASIADKIELNEEREEWKTGPVYKFVNPSCFF